MVNGSCGGGHFFLGMGASQDCEEMQARAIAKGP